MRRLVRLAVAAPLALSVGCDPANVTRVASENLGHQATSQGQRAPARAGASCSAVDLKGMLVPLRGENGKDWAITNYRDHGRADKLRDYTGAEGSYARVYDGHNGTDFAVPSYREMDSDKGIVVAVAPGHVEFFRHSEPDRNAFYLQQCRAQENLRSNFVRIRHDNGFATIYGHLKRGSVRVVQGQRVSAGTPIGVVGSSGCSTSPHLHLTVLDCADAAIDPFAQGLWAHEPDYNPASRVLDVMLKRGEFASADEVRDSGPDTKRIRPGEKLGIGANIIVRPQDVLKYRLLGPTGQLRGRWWWTAGSSIPRLHKRSHFVQFKIDGPPGVWTVEVGINDQTQQTRTIAVQADASDRQEVVLHHVADDEYGLHFRELRDAGYRTIWLDGYQVEGKTYFNAIWRPAQDVPWGALRNMDQAAYERALSGLKPGWRPLLVDNYATAAGIRYLMLFAKEAGPAWQEYHAVNATEHQRRFNAITSQGYRPVSMSVVTRNGERVYAALFDKAQAGQWTVRSVLSHLGLAYRNAQQNKLGRRLSYVNTYQLNGQLRFSAIWNEGSRGASHLRTDLHSDDAGRWLRTMKNAEHSTDFLAGYVDDNGSVSHVGQWKQ